MPILSLVRQKPWATFSQLFTPNKNKLFYYLITSFTVQGQREPPPQVGSFWHVSWPHWSPQHPPSRPPTHPPTTPVPRHVIRPGQPPWHSALEDHAPHRRILCFYHSAPSPIKSPARDGWCHAAVAGISDSVLTGVHTVEYWSRSIGTSSRSWFSPTLIYSTFDLLIQSSIM